MTLFPKPASRFSQLSNDFLVPVLTAAVAVSLMLVALGSFNAFNVSQGFQHGITRDFQVQRLNGEVIHLNEVMTMSARMAATTGDLAWEGRYQAYAPILETSLMQAKQLATETYEPYAVQISRAALELEAMNLKSFDFVRRSLPDQAQAVLFSDTYKTQKEQYASGMRQWSNALNQVNQSNLTRYGTRLVWSGMYSMVSFWVLTLAWVTVLLMVKRYIRLRKAAESRLQRAKHQLEESHQALQVSKAALLQKASTLEETLADLQAAEGELEESNRELKVSKAALEQKASTLEEILTELQLAQVQMVQSEKMSSLGQLVAGVAHEINNPVNFIYANLEPIREYTMDLLKLVSHYQHQYPKPPLALQADVEAADLDFIQEDMPKILSSMEIGAERIRQIVLSLRNFSRSDEMGLKSVDIHEGLESTLVILQHRLKETAEMSAINIVREYDMLPEVACYPGQLNQVFMNLLSNAVDALDEAVAQSVAQSVESAAGCDQGLMRQVVQHVRGEIRIRTTTCSGAEGAEWVEVAIADTGIGIPADIQDRIFDAFFTTKPVGKGTGIGLSISHTIVTRKHGGKISCSSVFGRGAEFVIQIPVSIAAMAAVESDYVVQPPVVLNR